jgi:hypothetical protein
MKSLEGFKLPTVKRRRQVIRIESLRPFRDGAYGRQAKCLAPFSQGASPHRNER